MRDLGKPRYRRGDKIGRWEVRRYVAPERYAHGKDRAILGHRVTVRCVCGDERTVHERILYRGESRGCPSRSCMTIHSMRNDVARLRAARDELRQLIHDFEANYMRAKREPLVSDDVDARIEQANQRFHEAMLTRELRMWRPRRDVA